MKEYTFKQVMTESEALQIAEKKGDWLWNIVFKNKPLTQLKLHYIEYFLMDMETKSSPTLFQKLRGNAEDAIVKRILVLGNGTTGGVAVVTDNPNIVLKDFKEEDLIQKSNYSEKTLIENAQKLTHKVTHRIMGGMHLSALRDLKSVYRPFWVAYYGEMEKGNKVRYITIPADGGNNKRGR